MRTDATRPPLSVPRRIVASLAHQKAGQVIALRAAAALLEDGMSAAECRALLRERAEQLGSEVTLMGTREVGRA